jgi:hypothetical protein
LRSPFRSSRTVNCWYVTPFGSYIFSDSGRRSSDDWGGGLAIGKPVHPNWNVELRAMYEELSSESGGPGKYKNWSGTLDAHYFLWRHGGGDSLRLLLRLTSLQSSPATVGAIARPERAGDVTADF